MTHESEVWLGVNERLFGSAAGYVIAFSNKPYLETSRRTVLFKGSQTGFCFDWHTEKRLPVQDLSFPPKALSLYVWLFKW